MVTSSTFTSTPGRRRWGGVVLGLGLVVAALETRVPMTFGVLTTNSAEEALARAADGPSNKGWEAATAGVEMARIARALRSPGASGT